MAAITKLPTPISNPELTPEFVQQWLAAKVIAVDVETDFTLIPDQHASLHLYWKEDGTHKGSSVTIGTSYAAPITDVALVAPNLPPVVFNMRSCTIYTENPDPYQARVRDFIAMLLGRTDITIVGHNLVFDLRQLGGHYGFVVSEEAAVWDTQVMGIRAMLAEDRSKGAFGSGFGLKELARHLGLIVPETTVYRFLDLMKSNVRSNIGDVLNAVESHEHPEWFWELLGGKPENEEEQERLAQRGVELYVMADAYLAYRIYRFQKNFIEAVAQADVDVHAIVKYPQGYVPKVYHYPHYPKILEHATVWQEQTLLSANWAIKGVKFDIEAALHRQEAAQRRFSEIMNIMPIVAEEDEAPEFRAVYELLLWYDMVLGAIGKLAKSGKASTMLNISPQGGELPYWKPKSLPEDRMRTFLSKYLITESVSEFWVDVLLSLNPEEHFTNGRLAKALQGITLAKAPYGIDLVSFCQDWHYSIEDAIDPPTARWRAISRHKWLKYLMYQKEAITSMELWGKQAWRPYFVFVYSGMHLPFDEDFYQNSEIITNNIIDKANAWTKRTKLYGEAAPYRDFILLAESGLSFNKDAMDFYIKEAQRDEELEIDVSKLKLFREVAEADGLIKRVDEFLAHASVDGKVHSITIPATRTGRDRSSSPNLQNLKMAKSKDFGHKYTFAGLIVAPEGYWFIELDFSNAENKTGALTAVDDAFARATEFGDFHTTMAMKYWPLLDWSDMMSEEFNKWRKAGKIVTFGTAYGMGAVKLAAKLKISLEAAAQILRDKDLAFPKVVIAKSKLESAIARMAASTQEMYPYIELWDGQRVAVPRYLKGKDHFEVPGYKGWNFVQQGGVSVLIHRAAININKMLRRMGYKTHIAVNVHDSLILAMNIEEYYNTDVLQKVIQIMVDTMPKELCRLTTPEIEFVANADIPGNAQKWGFHDTKEYPFPRTEYTDYWGHRIPMDEADMKKDPSQWEAPTRKAGPEWNFSPEEMAVAKAALFRRPEEEETHVAAEVWSKVQLQEHLESIQNLWAALQETGHPLVTKMDKSLRIKISEEQSIVTNGFVDTFLKTGLLAAKGYEQAFEQTYKAILTVYNESNSEQLEQWLYDHRYYIPNSFKSTYFKVRGGKASVPQEQPQSGVD